MTEEQVFLAALDLANEGHRKAYLDKVCGESSEFRQRVDELLDAHFKSGEFLNEPLGQQLGTKPAAPTIQETMHFSTDRQHASPPADKTVDEQTDDLRFLEPSSRPGALGRIGHYDVLQVLGKGGFGIVFRAFDNVLQRVVALKVLAPAIAATSPARKRFVREAVASAQVRHENVVQVYEVEQDSPLPYLAMEFIAGETLQQRLDREGPLEPMVIARLGRQIAEGLAAAHATGLIHRDIKPGNILIEGRGTTERVKITDFGLARAADDASMTQSGMVAGTPMFMAPEQVQGHILDQRADLFSLGSVLYVMTCGRPPFRAGTTFAVLKRVVDDEARPINDLIPETPKWLCDVIGKLHKKKPEQRYQSSREVADALANCQEQLKASPQLSEIPRITQTNPPSLLTWPWVAMACVILIGIIVLVTATSAGLTALLRPSWRANTVASQNDLKPDSDGRVETTSAASESSAANVEVPSEQPESPTAPPAAATRADSAVVQGLRELIVTKEAVREEVKALHQAGTKTELDLIYPEIDLCEARIQLAKAEGDDVAYAALLKRFVALRVQERSMVDAHVAAGKLQPDELERADSSLVDARGRLAKALAETPSAALFTDADISRIAKFPAQEQVEKVRAELKRRNPDFDGTLAPAIEDGVVTKLSFNSDHVDDIAPLRALTGLVLLDCRGTYPNKGALSDLAPLKGLALQSLDCSSTQISDLSPLTGMPLTFLQFNHNPVADLAPLKGMPLESLGCAETKVSDFSPLESMKLRSLGAQLLPVTDLSPLQGMPLTGLDLYHTTGVTSLEPLRGMPLEGLNLQDVPVRDLSPLVGMNSLRTLVINESTISDLSPLADLKLTDLIINCNQVSDLSPIQKVPVHRLIIFGTSVTDLTPLQGMPLKEFRFDPQNITRGIEVLRGIPSLETIGTATEAWPTAEFWERYDQGEFKN
jgi:serine/threonine protein kinase